MRVSAAWSSNCGTNDEGLTRKIAALNAEFVSLAKQNSAMRRLTSIPGIGVLNATALVAAVGDAGSFQHARDLGAWLGLVPRQFIAGGKGAATWNNKAWQYPSADLARPRRSSCMHTLSQSDTPIGQWLRTMLSRGVQRNVVIVALANKLARIAWAVLRKGQPYERAYGIAAI